jgi:hypothetical protein
MRLLELGGASIRRRFILYAPGKCIEWTDYSANYAMDLGSGYVPAGATASEQTLRQAKLLSLISVHTGLAPRTLRKSMQRDPASSPGAQRRTVVVVFFVCVLIMVGIMVVDIVFPITPYRWVNWASAGSLALATLVLSVFSARLAKTNRRLPEQATPPSASAPPLDGSGIRYTLSWKSPLLRRLVGIGLGVCLLVNLLPALWVLLPALFGSSFQPVSENASPSIGTFVLAGTLALFGVMGAGLAYSAATTGTLRIQADTDGLTIDIGRRREVILWSSIQDISWGAGRTSQFAYLVKGDVPTAMISWSAGLQGASASPPEDGTVPIGGDELAALVASRTGLVLRVRTRV